MVAVVLLTSLGSGVCTAVLDCLEDRRADLVILGVGSNPEAPDRDRCDGFIKVPPTADPDWPQAMTSAIGLHAPTAVIPGRCDDVVAIAHLARSNKSLADALLSGPFPLAAGLRDTGLAAAFAREHGLPFAPTLRTGLADSPTRVEEFLRLHGGPWILKPASSQASRGAVITNRDDVVWERAGLAGHVLQPYLGQIPRELEARDPLPALDVHELNDADAQVVLDAQSRVIATAGFTSVMIGGRVVAVERHADPAVAGLADEYAHILSNAGWRGPVNIQAAQQADGRWLPFEINPRFSGGSALRASLGFDEVVWSLRSWLGDSELPALATGVKPRLEGGGDEVDLLRGDPSPHR